MANKNLNELRTQIDECDRAIAEAFAKRMAISGEIAKYKVENNISLLDLNREEELISNISKLVPDVANEIPTLYSTILSLSRNKQERDYGLDGGNDMSTEFLKKLPIPMEVKSKYHLSATATAKKAENDKEIADVITGASKKKILVIGPCSADRADAVKEYCGRLADIQKQVKDQLILIARVYTAKPRTNGDGYKGLIHQPDRINNDIFSGIYAARKLDADIIEEFGIPVADELLYTSNYRFFSDLLSYVAVGARSSEDQEHRFVASGIKVPVGMKNTSGGDMATAINSVYAAQNPHDFIYRNWEVSTKGNPLCHTILRGYTNEGKSYPNYDRDSILKLCHLYEEKGLPNPGFVVDTNHANSNKNYAMQPDIC
ncbi:MAG: 3-deoxy-7-phosphoheptulonate synthase, partial [Clostridia bacterium]|nr:3-deoxy-7-phosphoheptulonate synthase [Clostridia bacterium]